MQFQLNLASKPYLDRRSVSLWLLIIGGFLLFLLVSNLTYAYQNYRQYQAFEQYLSELESRFSGGGETGIASYTPEEYLAVSKRIGLLNSIVEADQFRWTGLLGRLEELLPDEVSIRSIHPDFKNRSLQISAIGRDVADMTAFLDALLESPDLFHVYLQGQTEGEMQAAAGRSKSIVSFSLTIREAF
jgi:hypothetical protein